MRSTITSRAMMLFPLALTTCGAPDPTTVDLVAVGPAQPAAAERQQASGETLETRLRAVDRAVLRWQTASNLRTAREAAEEARNLIVGASGPFYGDADKNGQVAGKRVVGVLPGQKGEVSLAGKDDNACVVADVLGGSWREPVRRWSQFQSALSRWTNTRNTFPSLPSHAQRVVGWASLTLKSNSLVEAREYAKHARLHIDISVRAVTSCRRYSRG